MKYSKTPANSRRQFLQDALVVGAGVSMLGGSVFGQGQASHFLSKSNSASKSLNILLLGGTSFLGPHQIAAAMDRGHSVTTFTRGKTQPTIHKDLFADVEALIGDRENNLEALKNRKWDVVIDNSGRKVQWTKDTANLLKDQVDLYMYTSSLSVFYPFTGTDFSEEREVLLSVPEGTLTEENKQLYDFGLMKANSEVATREIFGEDRSVIIRPAYIVGPADPFDRFIYWNTRFEKGGEILIPGKASDPVQYIDVRDLAEWMIRLAENKASGTYNASGPGFTMPLPVFVYGAHATYNTSVSFVQVDDYDFLEKQGVPFLCPWVLPKGEFYGMGRSNNYKAMDHGLTFRPLSSTIGSIREWLASDAVSEKRAARIKSSLETFMEKEVIVLKAWKKLKG